MGSCACPSCLTPKSLFGSLSLIKDMQSHIQNLCMYAMTKVLKAREYIYKRGNAIYGLKLEDAFGEGSHRQVFSTCASNSRLDACNMVIHSFHSTYYICHAQLQREELLNARQSSLEQFFLATQHHQRCRLWTDHSCHQTMETGDEMWQMQKK
jgi:hypothetical protein